ncbi:hypothetical protein EBU94_07685, partial [bacterium]|nr:hypothetical protein [bacterium]
MISTITARSTAEALERESIKVTQSVTDQSLSMDIMLFDETREIVEQTRKVIKDAEKSRISIAKSNILSTVFHNQSSDHQILGIRLTKLADKHQLHSDPLFIDTLKVFRAIHDRINSTQIQGKNYLYQVVSSRFFHKLIPLYSNSVLMKRITDIQKGIKGEQYKSKKTDSALKSLSLNKDFPYHYSFRESLSSYQSKIKYITNHLKSRTKDEVNLGELRNLLASYKEKKGEPSIKLHKTDLPNPDTKEVKVAENSIDNFVKTLSKFGRSANLDTTYAIIRFDYLGIKLDKPLKIIWEDLKTVLYESFFKQPVIYYQDQSDRKVYFNMKYLNLLGYKEPNGTYCNYLGANIYLEKELSLNQKLQYLGTTGDRTNIMESVKSYLTYKFPQLTPQDIENKIFKLGNVDDFTDKDIIEAKEYCLANLNNERDNNVKVCINRIKIAIY